MKTKLLVILKIISVILALGLVSCEKDLYENQTYQSRLMLEKVSLDRAASRGSINNNLYDAIEKIKANKQKGEARIVYDSINDIYFDDTSGVKITKDDLESYTFKIIKEGGFLENIVFNKNFYNEFEVYKIKYFNTEEEIKAMSEEEKKTISKEVKQVIVLQNGEILTQDKTCIVTWEIWCNMHQSPRDDSFSMGECEVVYTFTASSSGNGGGSSSAGGTPTDSSGGEGSNSNSGNGNNPSNSNTGGYNPANNNPNNGNPESGPINGGSSVIGNYNGSNPEGSSSNNNNNSGPNQNHGNPTVEINTVAVTTDPFAMYLNSVTNNNIVRSRFDDLLDRRSGTVEYGYEFNTNIFNNNLVPSELIMGDEFGGTQFPPVTKTTQLRIHVHYEGSTEFAPNGLEPTLSLEDLNGFVAWFVKKGQLGASTTDTKNIASIILGRAYPYALRIQDPVKANAFYNKISNLNYMVDGKPYKVYLAQRFENQIRQMTILCQATNCGDIRYNQNLEDLFIRFLQNENTGFQFYYESHPSTTNVLGWYLGTPTN